MAKRLKLRISKAVSSSFHSCRSKDPSALPQDPVPSFFLNSQLLTVDHFPIMHMINPPPPSKPHHSSSFNHPVSAAAPVTSGGRCSSRNEGVAYTSDDDSSIRSPSQEIKWKKEEDKWRHFVKTIYDDTKQQPRRRISYSSFSDDSDNDDILAKKNKCEIINFSDKNANWDHDNININEDEEDETESIIISPCKRSVEYFSDDSSSDFSQELETIYDTATTRRQKKIATTKRRVKNTRDKNKNGRRSSSISTTTTTTMTMTTTTTSSDDELPPRLSVFKKIIPCNVDGKVKDSFAIVKKSEDPYEDFKKSMMEMILEKQMYEKNDLEKLLQCFLSLNAKNYHGVIVEAFSHIWKTLFSPNHS